MIKCKTCGADIAANAKACPQCGAKNKKPIYTKWWFYVLIVLVVIVIASSGAGNKSDNQNSTGLQETTVADTAKKESTETTGENAIQGLNNALSKSKLEEVAAPEAAEGDFGLKKINGSLKNISGKTLSYVQITFALYDEDGAQIGTAVANINNLTKDSVWKYSATPLTTDEWVSFEVTEIDCW